MSKHSYMHHRYSYLIFAFSSILIVKDVFSQDVLKTSFVLNRTAVVDPKTVPADFHAEIKNLEKPAPDGSSYQSFLMGQKQKARAYYRSQSRMENFVSLPKSNHPPQVGFTFQPTRFLPNGVELPIYGGIPSDNTLAISDDGIAIVAMNSTLYAHDIYGDTAVFPDYQFFLRSLANGVTTSTYYDPKLYYDPTADRFICALLKDNTPEKSEVIICISSTSNPNDEWYVYNLPGNPLNNNRWTDFPVITVTEEHIYFTANLIIPGVSWQVGFDGSIIWEMDKSAGYSGSPSLNATLYSNITYENKFIRNLHAVQGSNGIMNDLILLSNRNFAVENDTIFYLRLTNGNLTVDALKTNVPYGVPPNARQQDTDTSDVTLGLQTNDARVLGAIRFEDHIQFVSNTMHPTTGFSAIYHGIIEGIEEGTPMVYGTIVGDSIRDYAYPNIASSGNEACDIETIIAFDYSSFTDFPGTAAFHYSNDGQYSPVTSISEGLNYVDRLPGGYERWGDYFGLQRKYNEKGKVYSFGYFAMQNKSNSGYFAELINPDSSQLQLALSLLEQTSLCDNQLQLQISAGEAPYKMAWSSNNSEIYSTAFNVGGLCATDTVMVTVTDNRGCSASITYVVPPKSLEEGVSVFPNPSSDLMAIQFMLDIDAYIRVALYDDNGRLVKVLREEQTKAGLNELSFSLQPIAEGIYSLVILKDETLFETHKIIKTN